MSKRTSIRRRDWQWNQGSLMPSCWLTKNESRPASQSTAGVKQQKISPFLGSSGVSQPALGPNILPSLSFRAVLLQLILPLHSFSLDYLLLSQTYRPANKITNYTSSSGRSLRVHLFLAVIFLFDWWNTLMFPVSDSICICTGYRRGGVVHEHTQDEDFEGVWIWIYTISVCMHACTYL